MLFTRSMSRRIAASRAAPWFGMLSVLLRSFIFGPFLPVLFGATNRERTCSRILHERWRVTHACACDLNHRLAAAANGWFKHRMYGHQAEGNEDSAGRIGTCLCFCKGGKPVRCQRWEK